jgi:CRP-like cAMP-binding protein
MAQHEVLDRRVYAPGEIIFKEGEIGRRCAFLVQSGRVEISKRSPDGSEKLLGAIGAGGIFGEMALVDNKPRMAMAKASEATAVVIVTEAALEAKLRKADPFIRGLLNIFVRNIREMADRLTNSPG